MSSADGFHPNLRTTETQDTVASFRTRVHHVKASDVSQTLHRRRVCGDLPRSVGARSGRKRSGWARRVFRQRRCRTITITTNPRPRSLCEAGTPSSYSMTVTPKSASPRRPVITFSSRRLFRTAKRIRTRAIPL